MIITMSKEVDEKFKNWQGKGKDYSVELQYRSLCRCLFGDSIRVPSNISKALLHNCLSLSLPHLPFLYLH